jgi:hypothetical protein
MVAGVSKGRDDGVESPRRQLQWHWRER